MNVEETEAETISKALSGDSRAKDKLYRRYLRLALYVANRSSTTLCDADIDDVVQESFIRTFKSSGIEDFRAYLSTVVRNRVRNFTRERANRYKLGEDSIEQKMILGEPVPPASEEYEKAVDVRIVRQVIDELGDSAARETIRLFYVEGSMSVSEIAQRVGLGKSGVSMRLKRFRDTIRLRLMRECA